MMQMKYKMEDRQKVTKIKNKNNIIDKLINLSKKNERGMPYEIDPNLSDKERFNIILNNKQKKIKTKALL